MWGVALRGPTSSGNMVHSLFALSRCAHSVGGKAELRAPPEHVAARVHRRATSTRGWPTPGPTGRRDARRIPRHPSPRSRWPRWRRASGPGPAACRATASTRRTSSATTAGTSPGPQPLRLGPGLGARRGSDSDRSKDRRARRPAAPEGDRAAGRAPGAQAEPRTTRISRTGPRGITTSRTCGFRPGRCARGLGAGRVSATSIGERRSAPRTGGRHRSSTGDGGPGAASARCGVQCGVRMCRRSWTAAPEMR